MAASVDYELGICENATIASDSGLYATGQKRRI